MANVNHIKLTCPEARGLKCPYTGKEYVVYAHICDGLVTYNVPAAFTLRKPRKSAATLYHDASMRNGIYGAVDFNGSLIDPFTKVQMSLREDKGEYWMEGGFDPTLGSLNFEDFIFKLSCGNRQLKKAEKATSVEHVGDMTPDDSDAAHKVVDEETQKAAEEFIKAAGANKGRTVTGYQKPVTKEKVSK